MSKGNRIKAAALGMSHGTAANRLRKMVLFSLVCRLDLNFCYRCNKEIISVNDISLEHKESWLNAENPKETFFDLDNITFSHFSCNSSAHVDPRKKYDTDKERWRADRESRRSKMTVEERKTDRRKRYEKYGH